MEGGLIKQCTHCKLEFTDPELWFYKNRQKKDGLDYRCKACYKKYQANRPSRGTRPKISKMEMIKRQLEGK